MACCSDTTQHSVACLISLSSWKTSSDDEIDRRHWVLGLLSRVGITTIPIQCSLLQTAEQEQDSKMMTRLNRPLSHTWRACNKNSIWLASKSCLINVTYALVSRVIMLNNNIKILLVSFVHHIELQNFLNAPRNYASKSNPLNLKLLVRKPSFTWNSHSRSL